MTSLTVTELSPTLETPHEHSDREAIAVIETALIKRPIPIRHCSGLATPVAR
jgi:hypothetical protein